MRVVPALAAAVIAASMAVAHDAGRVRVPLTDMGSDTYLGFPGGLYPDASNTVPTDHALAGIQQAAAVVPRNAAGVPDPAGRYVMVSIGMSNTTQEFCGGNPCAAGTFMPRAAADPKVNHQALAIVDGAAGGQAADTWDSPADPNYDRVRDTRLAPRGLTEAQVQVAWVKVANATPTVGLPSAGADAYRLVTQTGNIARALKTRYPNLQQVFLSSRSYGGYATTTLNPEPFAYETGLAARWVITAQIEQMRTGVIDPRAGDLDYANGRAPWIAWGPYLWAAGTYPRSDGLTWERADFVADGTHPSPSGRAKVGALLLSFFKESGQARCWFTTERTCSLD